MVVKCICGITVFACCVSTIATADTVELKENAAIIGKVLSEKRDQVAVDVGYTVLSVPKSQVVRIKRDLSENNTVKAQQVRAEMPGREPALDTKSKSLYASAQAIGEQKSVRELVSLLGESVVQVRTPSGLGSGFFINEEGFLITNFHVIEGETQITAEVYHQHDGQLDQKSYKSLRIVAVNKFADLALLKVEDDHAPKFKPVAIGRADSMSVGERVFAIGSPLGLERTVTEGILSTRARQLGGELYLQTTTQINPGNSGGPLFNMSGEVIGVTNMKITFGEGLGFAIPVESVRFFLEHRDSFAYSNVNPSSGFRYLEPPSRTRQAMVEE